MILPFLKTSRAEQILNSLFKFGKLFISSLLCLKTLKTKNDN
jgi:hypothetical protein